MTETTRKHIEEITEGRTIWNSDGTDGPCLICPPPTVPPAPVSPATHIYPNHLAARVAARNEANKLAMSLHTELVAKFAPFVGTKVVKKNNGWRTLTKKVEAAVGPLPTAGGRVHLRSASWRLAYDVSVGREYYNGREFHPTSTADACAYIGIGRLEGEILVELEDPPKLRTDYTEAEIRRLRAEATAAEEAAREAKSKLGDFGEYDR